MRSPLGAVYLGWSSSYSGAEDCDIARSKYGTGIYCVRKIHCRV